MFRLWTTRYLLTAIVLLTSVVRLSAHQTTAPPARKSTHKSSDTVTAHHAPKSASSRKTSRKGKHSKKAVASKKHGQQKIDSERALQIQQALVREHYLTGSPSGVWDDSTQQAMQKFQADNGWQSKTTPDSRALIKLGLGPDHEHLLNPESAMTAPPESAHSVPATQPSPSANPQTGQVPQ